MARWRIVPLILALGAAAALAHAQPAAPPVELRDVTVVPGDAAVTVMIMTSGPPKPTVALMDGPWRIVLDFEGCEYRWAKNAVAVGREPVKEIRGSQYRKGIARIVIELTRRVPYTIEPHAEGLRVVLGVAAPPATAAAPPVAKTPAPRAPVLKAPAPAPAPPPAAPPVAARPPEPEGPRLQGIVWRDEGSVAYIADPATKQIKRYQVGDALGDAVVEAIAERSVTLRTPRGPLELKLAPLRPAAR
ncbi:MAG: AMIN domain-containing protein [Candidatus Rokubacteria bacterium]|nr:AMIN domain-containing protein [Candidatus Rokubacteria bacterium]